MLGRVFEPLGYSVEIETFVSVERFPAWGESRYVNLTIRGKVRLRDLLKHIYVLIPVFDRQKHYWVGTDEVEKLLRVGEDWLPGHPEKGYITARYLGRRRPLINLALARLTEAVEEVGEEITEPKEKRLNLNAQRLGGVVAALKGSGAASVIDLGCGEGNLLQLLIKEKQFTRIAGADVSSQTLGWAAERLRLDMASDSLRERLQLFQASLTYKDARFEGYDAAAVIEVIEHLDPSRLSAFEKVLFAYARPKAIVLTTPNREYNAKYEGLTDGALRHGDHRFEWTRVEFRDWATKTAERFSYAVQFSEIGDVDETCGTPTQMGVFTLYG